MAQYEVEHGIVPSKEPRVAGRRPDMSTFFSKFSQVDTSGTDAQAHNNVHATPTPSDVASLYHLLADGYAHIRNDSSSEGHQAFLDNLISEAQSLADNPPDKIEGVPQTFLDSLDRVPKKSLKKTDVCPICGEEFLADKYPLVVELPCHASHKFDMDCIAPWLKMQGTCPLDRKDVMKREVVIPVDDEEEEYDDMIG